MKFLSNRLDFIAKEDLEKLSSGLLELSEVRSTFSEREEVFNPMTIKPNVEVEQNSPVKTSFHTNEGTDIFLTHDWGENGLTHKRVSKINDSLKKRGIVTWFDGDRMKGDIKDTMINGIENTKCVLVFVTERYRSKVNSSEDRDNCRFEFKYAVEQKGPQNMLAAVLEPSMKNPKEWKGILGGALGSKLYVDMVDDDESETSFESKCEVLYQQIIHIIGTK